MENEKLKNLEKELDLYRKKLTQMQKDWSASRGGSRYGDEYLEMQIKVYQDMIISVKKEIFELRRKK
ncbi:hypothetical protein A2574_04010 [Candidatus Shapirobacteria bacterium RIFOXYD1_FULL_38_32]|nr:MAG: hypothetical protein A2195_00395 [Candidatus Shapirobacteria bacterium RIFOXYA1_FULL_39_17]OGL56481.1 MAG: hypothetical protein A2410_03000 [Candidatus Shapirobacteria bacterium RIFOXYC1_FULL_38_24]OGL58361.1 MAG: hypothetical protein A2574_04010 [Candidatus Shapirobacteria bacterium RIFOXYD1_FULL_38_32]HAP37418.1 hypothetical protein [Candidatus Shapirobacteria bacterium]HAP37680.1 hypothetical protein [Candidatus Shapirobacteria bacterium]